MAPRIRPWLAVMAATVAVAVGRAGAQQAPAGVRVWVSDVHDPEDKDLGVSPPSVTIVAARNGFFSGKVVVSPAQQLKAAVSDLKQGAAVIPASAVRVRYALPWEANLAGGSEARGPDILLEEPPAQSTAGRVPVWLTVKVPADAKHGTYTGELTVGAAAAVPARVPVRLEVADWAVPDPGARQTLLELIQSPDTLSLEYGVPLWSDKHFDLIARSMDFLGEAGSRVLYVPLIEHTNAGNEQSMVRWTKKGPGQYGYDFSVMDRYLDLAEKHMGKPRLVVFNVWDRYLTRPGAGGRDFQTQTGLKVAASGPIVTMVDPAGGAVQHALLPDYPSRQSLTVAIDRLRGAAPTAAEFLQTRLEVMKQNLSDFQQRQTGTAAIDGQQARWATFSCSMGPFRVQGMLYILIKEGRAIHITCLSREDQFNSSRPVFEKMAASFQLKEKDLVLDCPPEWEKADFQYRDAGVGFGVVAVVWGPGDGAGASDPVRQAWKSLFDQLRERMKARGLDKAMLLGMASDFWATKDQVVFLKDVSGDLPWANASHYFRKPLWEIADVSYHAFYFGVRFGYKGSLYGWKRPEIALTFDRAAFLDGWPMARWRHMGEYSITGNVRGVGRLGADTWNVIKDRTGQRKGRVYQRYPQTDWGYLNIRSSLLAPGPAGALATSRFEILREGIQDCEARIVLERALTEAALRAKLGQDLASRCEQALAERTECLWKAVSTGNFQGDGWRKSPCTQGHLWFLESAWPDRSRKLYALAGEVAAKLK